MRAWSGDPAGSNVSPDAMGPTVDRESPKPRSPPPLKNGSDMRESGYLISVGSRTARFRRKYKKRIITVPVLILIIVLLCLAIVMTALYVKLKRHKPPPLCETRECLRSAANLALSMDPTADPCEDFYQYACGKWAEEHPRPDAYQSYDWFRDKQSKVYSLVRDFFSRNLTQKPRPVQQAKDMYDACMDIETLNKRGIKPMEEVLEALGLPLVPTFVNLTEDFDYSTYSFDWVEAVIKVKTQLGMDVLIGFDIFTDPKNSSMYRLVMGSPETTNPFPSMQLDKKRNAGRKQTHRRRTTRGSLINDDDHRYETNLERDNAEKERINEKYKVYYAELLKIFVGDSNVAKDTKLSESEIDQNVFLAASEYFSMEDDMYELRSSNSSESEDNLYSGIPEYTAEDLQTLTDGVVEANNGTPTAVWKRYLEGIFAVTDVTLDFDQDKVLVSEPDLKYMALMAAYVAKTPPVVMELYIWFSVVEVMSMHTTSELRLLYQRVYEGTRRGGNARTPPRALQCATAINDMLGMAVTYAILEPHFVDVTKPKILTMLHEMKNALSRLVGRATWMDDNTKLATYEKIIEMKILVGYPDWLLEDGRLEEYYAGIEVDPHTHLENMVNVIQKRIKKAMNKFREGNNFTWATDPTEVNAYHTFQENTVTVPLVMLQYPFFNLGLDSLNYGSLGTILGHEITHGFDNFGRQFDKNGNLLPWWSNATVESFVNATQCFVDQYSEYYIPEIDEHVDGKMTLGENIADNGGLREALLALHEHLSKRRPEPKLPGFEHMSSDQLFFLAYGNLWCGTFTRESLRSEASDEHAPQRVRARGSLRNAPEFAHAFRCGPRAALNPPKGQRCVIF